MVVLEHLERLLIVSRSGVADEAAMMPSQLTGGRAIVPDGQDGVVMDILGRGAEGQRLRRSGRKGKRVRGRSCLC